MEKLKKKTWKNVGIALCCAAICGLVIFVVFLLTSEKRTEIIGAVGTLKMTGLVCEKPGNDNKYFNKEKAVAEGKHGIHANFYDDKLVDLMYTYEAAYADGVDLVHIKNVAQANFGLEYGNRYVYKDNLWRASFIVDEDKKLVRMNIYAGANSLENNVAEVFQLDRNQAFPKTGGAMESAYKNAGYTCEISNS